MQQLKLVHIVGFDQIYFMIIRKLTVNTLLFYYLPQSDMLS